MKIQSVDQKVFSFAGLPPVVVEPCEAQLTSDAGLLPIRQLDERLGLTARFAAALTDPRQAGKVAHCYEELVRCRVYGILADYADQNDHDALRSDPVFKLIAGRRPTDDDLASQPTHSRFENAVDIASLNRLRDEMVDEFIAAFKVPPVRLTFDIDPFDDPTHGQQQLTFFHGYYKQYQYLPRAMTCAENDLVVMVCLLHGTAHATLGADDDIEYLVQRLRTVWPDVHIHLRGDSGFGSPVMYQACEEQRIEYSIGIGMNVTLKAASDLLLQQAVETFAATGIPQRLFHGQWYQAGSWDQPRWVVIKVEAHAQGTNRRAVVINRPGAQVLPGAAYDEYANRGESENRNKELKRGLHADRLSDHRYLANLFRLYLHVAAYNLLTRLRTLMAIPPETIRNSLPVAKTDPQLPTEALPEPHRRAFFNRRRERDILGEAQPDTWRTRLIKVAALVTTSARRVRVQLSGTWPYLHHYAAVSDVVLSVGPTAAHSVAPTTS